MRILSVTQSYAPFYEFGGPPIKVEALANGLTQRGHEVTVLTADWGFESRQRMQQGANMAETLRVRMDQEIKRRANHLFEDVFSLPGRDVESRHEAILPRAARDVRSGAHFWPLRFAGTVRGQRVPDAANSLCDRTHWNVRADCAKYFFEAHISCTVGQGDAPRSRCGDSDSGAGSGGAGSRRNSA